MKKGKPEKLCHLFYSAEKEKVYGSFEYICLPRFGKQQFLCAGNMTITTESQNQPEIMNNEGFDDWEYCGIITSFVCGYKSGYKLPNW